MPITLHKPPILNKMKKQELLIHIDDLTEFIEIFIGEDIQDLANQIRDLKKENERLQSNSVKHYDEMENLIEKEGKKSEIVFKKLTKRDNKINHLKQELHKTSEEKLDLYVKWSDLNDEKKSWQEGEFKLTKELSEERTKIVELQKEIEDLKFNLDGMTCDRDAKEEEINNMIDEHKKFDEIWKTEGITEQDIIDMKRQISDQCDLIKKLKEEKEENKYHAERNLRRVNILGSTIDELKEEIRILKQYQKDDNLKRVISLKEKDNEELSEKLDKSIEESQKWQDKYYTLKSSIQQFKNSLNNLE